MLFNEKGKVSMYCMKYKFLDPLYGPLSMSIQKSVI